MFNYLFLFPADYFNSKKPDEMYLEQMFCLENLSFQNAVINLESLEANSPKIYPSIIPNSTVVYRGWILSPSYYKLLVKTIDKASANAFISEAEYVATHYLPNWYPLIAEFTPETRFFTLDNDLAKELKQLNWGRFFIKDYVKSLKTSVGSIIDQPSDIEIVVKEMKKFRGTLEGGICVRKVEDFIAESERRYFVLNGKAFAPIQDESIPEVVLECAKRIKSKFFSVDVIERQDGMKRIVEIGDGQVSDIIGWSIESFCELWTSSR